MRPYAIVDLHCDTLTDCMYNTSTPETDTLNDPNRVLSFASMPEDVKWAQFYAVFVKSEYRGEAAVNYFKMNADRFDTQMKKYSGTVSPCRSAADVEKAWSEGKRAAMLTVEDGLALGGRAENVEYLKNRGVVCMGLVWNEENELASGHDTENGLSAFGKQVIGELERCGIIVDVSHLNDRGFYELLDAAEKPFAATHSNARSVCAHKRNLTDDMIRHMVERKCIIGLNYYINFLDDNGKADNPDFLYRHISRFLELGGENCLALGSDYDGCDLPEFMKTPEKVALFYDYLLSRGISEDIADKIYWKNALDFLRTNLAD